MLGVRIAGPGPYPARACPRCGGSGWRIRTSGVLAFASVLPLTLSFGFGPSTGRAEVAQSGTARVWKARGGIRLGSSKADGGSTARRGFSPSALPPGAHDPSRP